MFFESAVAIWEKSSFSKEEKYEAELDATVLASEQMNFHIGSFVWVGFCKSTNPIHNLLHHKQIVILQLLKQQVTNDLFLGLHDA